MLKFYLKKERLHFMRGWVTSEKQITVNNAEEKEEDPLEALLQGDFQNNLDEIIHYIDQYNEDEEGKEGKEGEEGKEGKEAAQGDQGDQDR